LCASPLPPNHPSVFPPQFSNDLRRIVANCRMIYPGFASGAYDLIRHIETLANISDNPLLDYIADICRTNELSMVALLLKESRSIMAVEEVLEQYQMKEKIRIAIVRASQLREGFCYQGIIVVGPNRWFPEYIFCSPRAYEIHVVNYNWIINRWEPTPIFFGTRNVEKKSLANTGEVFMRSGTKALENYLEWDELLPAINWADITSRISLVSLDDSINLHETVKANLFLLEGEYAVFLEASENAKVLVIELDEDECDDEEEESRVKRILASNIQPGMFIVLRTCGGGEYIITIADRILGDLAEKARDSLRKWKTRLREAVYSKGLIEVGNVLYSLGSTRANEVNIRNWIDERNIRPKDYKDFSAIMSYIGLKEVTKEYWFFAEAIDAAHKRAGFHIRKLLLKQVLSADLVDLEKMGRMDFELPEADGGTLTAFRVTDISPEHYKVPVQRIGHPFERNG
jgi:hypothetical protein